MRAHTVKNDIICSVIIPVFNEEKTIEKALTCLSLQMHSNSNKLLNKNLFEIIIVDNNSTDQTIKKITAFTNNNPDMNIVTIYEKKQGVAWARKSGMNFAVQRSKERDMVHKSNNPFYLFSTDADCFVDAYWIDAQLINLRSSQAALSVCQYLYPMEHFEKRPNLSRVISLLLSARDKAMQIFGGFPDGKGFAVLRDKYEKVGGIETFYQLSNGKFLCHLSDDWDFGIKIRASGEKITYSKNALVETNPRRVDHALFEMIKGKAYGENGIITMRDIRPEHESTYRDTNHEESQLLFDYSIKDFVTKHIILPVLLTPNLLKMKSVLEFLSPCLCEKLYLRIHEMVDEMRIIDFTPIHLYKTPCFRLYFEFRNEIFERMRICIDLKIGYPPALPVCLKKILQDAPEKFNAYVHYYCEDRESGEAHNYFGNGGVF